MCLFHLARHTCATLSLALGTDIITIKHILGHTSTTLALEPVRENSDNASAVLGFLSFFVGGVCSPLAGLGNMLVSTSIVIVCCAFGTLLLAERKAKVSQINS